MSRIPEAPDIGRMSASPVSPRKSCQHCPMALSAHLWTSSLHFGIAGAGEGGEVVASRGTASLQDRTDWGKQAECRGKRMKVLVSAHADVDKDALG
jgi:hypothetical protein